MNNINRDNYETFFLLYTDNELSAAEKKEVEEFVDANPDLQEELVMLQQSILKPDDIVFNDKKSLLKDEFIPSRLQEMLLLHLDNELTSTERDELEGLIKADANAKREWDILQQTKLSPANAIVFKEKRSLYRKEAGRVVAFPWWRIAAAAVFIGFVLWGGLAYFNNDTNAVKNETATKNPVNLTQDTNKPDGQQTTVQQVAPPIVKEKELALTPSSKPKKASAAAAIQSPEKAPRKLTGRDNQPSLVIEKNNNLPKPYSDNLNRIGSNKTIPYSVTIEKQLPGNNDIVKSNDKQDPANEYATTTSFDNSQENNDRVLFMDEEKIKKTKLGGFFRKVKRVLERSANIKPGDNNIKVANLEFAIQ